MNDAQLLLEEARQIRKLLELLAEPAIAQRDARFRDELRKIVGSSLKKRSAVFLMNGSRTQTQIVAETGVHAGELSTMVGKLEKAGLLADGKKHPKLSILIPANFFDAVSGAK
jgi:hypothetical protein